MNKSIKQMLAIVSAVGVLVGCAQPTLNYPDNSDESSRVQKIAQGMSALKSAAGITTAGRSLDNMLSGEISTEASDFLENPIPDLEKLSSDDSLQAQNALALIEAVTTETTLGELDEKMGKIDPKMASEFRSQMEVVYSSIPDENARSMVRESWRTISVNTDSLSSRGFLDKNWNWDTVNWYVGTSAASIAGIVIYRFTPDWVGWFPMWTVKYAGLLSAFGAYGAMGTQLTYWFTVTEEGKLFVELVKSGYEIYKVIKEQSTPSGAYEKLAKYFKDHNIDPNSIGAEKLLTQVRDLFFSKPYQSGADVTKRMIELLANSDEFGKKFALMGGMTVASIGTAVYLCWGEVSWIAEKIVSAYNGVVGNLPSWLTIDIFGFQLKRIG